jgi:syntaxin 16
MSDLSPTTRSRTLLFISYRDSRSTTTRFSRSRLDNNANPYGDAYTPEDERQGLISPKPAPGHVAIEINLPPKWYILFQILRYQISISPPVFQISCRVDLSDQVEEILTGTQSKSTFLFLHVVPLLLDDPYLVSALEKLHAKHVLPGFSDRSAEEREIEAVTLQITKVSSRYPRHSPHLSTHLGEIRISGDVNP